MDSRTTVLLGAGGDVGKRQLRKADTGKNVPAIAMTIRKKNNQRGPKVGRVDRTRITNPAQPTKAKISAAGI